MNDNFEFSRYFQVIYCNLTKLGFVRKFRPKRFHQIDPSSAASPTTGPQVSCCPLPTLKVSTVFFFVWTALHHRNLLFVRFTCIIEILDFCALHYSPSKMASSTENEIKSKIDTFRCRPSRHFILIVHMHICTYPCHQTQ
jgi:hypothetical protein